MTLEQTQKIDVKSPSAQLIEEIIPASLNKYFVETVRPQCQVAVVVKEISNHEFQVDISLTGRILNTLFTDLESGKSLELKKDQTLTLTITIDISEENIHDAFSAQGLIRRLIAAHEEKLRLEAEQNKEPTPPRKRIWFQ